MRLDRLLSNSGEGTRKEVKKTLKNGYVKVNDVVVKDAGFRVDPAVDTITIMGETVNYREFIYLMLNKPDGVVSATEDNRDRTVIDLLDEQDSILSPFPVGRLDKDTVGLLLITNDGDLAHRLLSPKKHVAKTYYAKVKGEVTDLDVVAFREGVILDDGYKTQPGELEIIASGPISEIKLTITEGKYHQVKRMFLSVGKKVTYLKRLSMGSLQLDDSLEEGHYRELTQEELTQLQQH